jgi:hypothetical protein
VGGSDAARQQLKGAAYNKGYVPPINKIWLARQLVIHLKNDRNEWRDKAISANKKLSEIKREKGTT